MCVTLPHTHTLTHTPFEGHSSGHPTTDYGYSHVHRTNTHTLTRRHTCTAQTHTHTLTRGHTRAPHKHTQTHSGEDTHVYRTNTHTHTKTHVHRTNTHTHTHAKTHTCTAQTHTHTHYLPTNHLCGLALLFACSTLHHASAA